MGYVLAEDTIEFSMHAFYTDAEAFQNAGSYTLALAKKAEKDMLRPDRLVPEQTGLVHRQLYYLLGSGSQTDCGLRGPLAAADNELNGSANLVQANAQIGEDFGCHAILFPYQPEQYMFSPDVVVVEPSGFLLG